MSLDAEVDAELDLGPMFLEVLGGVRAGIETLNKRLRNIAKIEEAYQFGAVEVMIRKAATSAASGSLIVGCGGPAYGRLWEVKRLTVGGQLWTTSVNGTAIVAMGSTPDGQAALTPPLSDIVDNASSLPSIAFYSTRQITVRHPNHLFVVILSPSATTQYVVGGQATDYPDKRLLLDTEN